MTRELQIAPRRQRDFGKLLELLSTPMMLLKVLLPVSLGILALILLLKSSYSEAAFDFSTTALAHRDPFKGTVFAHSVFVASIVVTMAGTGLYLVDMVSYMSLLHKKPGRKAIVVALWLTIATVVLPLLVMIVSLAMRTPDESVHDMCSYARVGHEFAIHFFLVGAMFVAFLAIDILTYFGMSQALPHADGKDSKTIRSNRRFARGQIWYVDFPVLIGGLLSWALFVTPQTINAAILAMDPEKFALTTGGARCMDVPMPTAMFEAMVSNLYLSGISAGYLAAHVLMSQLVFMALSVISHLEGAGAKDGATPPAAQAAKARQ